MYQPSLHAPILHELPASRSAWKALAMGLTMLLLAPAHAQSQDVLRPEEAGASALGRNEEERMLALVRQRPDYTPVAMPPGDQLRDELAAEVWDKLDSAPTARVILNVAMEDYERLRDLSLADRQPPAAKQADERLAAAIAEVVDQELAPVPARSCKILKRFRTIPAVALEVDAVAMQSLEASPGVQSIHLDWDLIPGLDNTTSIIEATNLWAVGYEASGWYVAVLDTGILASHEAFAGRDIIQACYCNTSDCPNGQSVDTTSLNAARHFDPPYQNFHGTHVSGIAAGNPSGGAADGVARSADLIAVQVFHPVDGTANCDGAEHCVRASTSDIVDGLEFVYGLRDTMQIAAVNLSLGGGRHVSACNGASTSTTAAINNLRSAGIITVISTGNEDYCGTIGFPSCITNAVSVGATDDADQEASFSNYHPDLIDVFAPGVQVLAPLGPGNSDYASWSGTSMAAPHVTGAIALMRDVFPGATVDEIISGLKSTGGVVSGRCVPTPGQRRIAVFSALDFLLEPRGVWVDFAYLGPEGGIWWAPFDSVAEAVAAAPLDATITMRSGSTPETLTINKPLFLEAFDGTVTIGQ